MSSARTVLLAAAFSVTVVAAPPASTMSKAENGTLQPSLCIGWNPERRDWRAVGLPPESMVETTAPNCPAGYAFTSLLRIGSEPGERIPVAGNCCKLPEGVLLDEHVEVEHACPKAHVITGAWLNPDFSYMRCIEKHSRNDCRQRWSRARKGIRCTRIAPRFQLGQAKPALNWGWPRTMADVLRQELLTTQMIPLGMRYSLGRRSERNWHYDGCVGDPPGALFVEHHGKHCRKMRTRQLQYAGRQGDPPAGTAVTVFPHCDAISDPRDPAARCLVAESKE